MSPRAQAPRAPQATTRLSWNYPREGRDGLCPQLPTRDRLGGGSFPAPRAATSWSRFPRGPGAEAIQGGEGGGQRGHVGARAEPGGARQTSWTERHPLAGPRVLSPRSGRSCPCARQRPAFTPDLAPEGEEGPLGGKRGAPGPGDGGQGAGTLWSSDDLGGALRPPGGAVPTPVRGSRGRRPRAAARCPPPAPPGGGSVQSCATPSPAPVRGSYGRRGGWETSEQNPQPRTPELPRTPEGGRGRGSLVRGHRGSAPQNRSGGGEEVL